MYSGYVNFREPTDQCEMELNLYIGGGHASWLYCNESNPPLPLDEASHSFAPGRTFAPLSYPAQPTTTTTTTLAKDIRSLSNDHFEPTTTTTTTTAMIPSCVGSNPSGCAVVRGIMDNQFQKSSTYSAADIFQDSQFQGAPFIFSSFQETDVRLARKLSDHGQNQYHAQKATGCLSHVEPSRPTCNISFTRIYTSNTPPPTSPKTRRVGKACQNCRIKKRKCSKSRPCKACEIDGRKCEAPPEKSDRKRRGNTRADKPKIVSA